MHNDSRNIGSLLNPNNLTVRATLIQAAVWVVVGNLAVLIAYLISGQVERAAQSENRAAAEIRQSADRIYAEVFQLAALEERLLRTKNLDLHLEHQEKMHSAMEDVDRLISLVTGNPAISDPAKAIRATLDDYESAMAGLVAAQAEVGVSQDTGLTGELGAVSAAVEYNTTATGNDRLLMFHKRLQGAERGYKQSKNADFLVPFEKAHDRFSKAFAAIDAGSDISTAMSRDLPKYLENFRLLVSSETRLAEGLEELQSLAGKIPPLVQQILELTSVAASEAQAEADSTRAWATGTVVGLSVLVMAVLISGFIWLIRRVAPPLKLAVERCQQIARGELSADVATDRNDEIGDLMRALNAMSSQLKAVVSDVRKSADSIMQGAEEISASSEHLSQRTEESAASLEQTAASMDEMTATVRQNAENASSANKMANQAKTKAEDGGKVVDQAIAAMQDIDASSKQVEKVISVVNEIAFQTNLLALNAAVEAARAGDAGRGFAVVASEVRNLAQRSAGAADEVRKLVSDSSQKVKVGTGLVNQSGATLEEILTAVSQVSMLISEIDAASNEQSEGIGQVNNAVVEMDKVTQQNAAMVEEATASAKTMEEEAQQLAQRMRYFQLDDASSIATSALPDPMTMKMTTPSTKPRPIGYQSATNQQKLQQPTSGSSGNTDEWQEF